MDAFRMVWEGDYGGLLIVNRALIFLPPKHIDAVKVKDFFTC